MPDNTLDPNIAPLPGPTPSGYQRTTGGNFRWEPPPVEKLQALLTGYDVLSLIGHGGMGAVYRARQRSLDRLVAIKILPPEAAHDDATFAERFKNEARTLARLNHPGIVHVHDFGETTDGQLYIVMEFVEGTDVQRMLMDHKVLTPHYALPITAHICDALQYSHTHGVVHRDIKPANVMLTNEGQVKVADFGLAKLDDAGSSALTQTNMSMGTPDYVAPETLTIGMTVDQRADLYAVGVMLYHMVVGEVPRGAFDLPSKRNAALDPRIDSIVVRCMKQNRDERYQSAAEIRADLDAILATPVVKSGGEASAAISKRVVVQSKKPKAETRSAPVKPVKPVKKETAAVGIDEEGEAEPKPRNLAWVVPTGISAMVILGGAFFMRAKRQEVPTPEEVTPKVAVTSMAPIKVSDYKPATTTQTPSSTAASTVTSITLKAGEWSLVRWPGDKPPKGEWKDGALHLPKREQCKLPTAHAARDAAIRARITNDSEDGSFKGIYFKLRNDNALGYFDLGQGDIASVGAQPDFKKDLITLAHSARGVVPLRKKDLLVEFAAIGDDLILALDGKVVVSAKTNGAGKVPVATGGRASPPFLASIMSGWGEAAFRDIEFMSLDGISADKHPDFIKTVRSAPAPRIVVPASAGQSKAPTPSPASAPAKISASPSLPLSASPPKLPAELAALQNQYAAAIAERVTDPYDTSLKQLNTGFLAALDRAIVARQLPPDAVLADKKAIAERQPLPPDTDATPDALRSLRSTYRAKLTEYDDTRTTAHLALLTPYVASLRQLESDLTKAGRTSDAEAVKAYRESLSENPFALPQAKP